MSEHGASAPCAESSGLINPELKNNVKRKKCAQDFKFIGIIGEGSFSMVALAVDTHSKNKYAIKICEKRQLLKEKKAAAIMREKEILNLLDSHPSPYFIRLHFSFQDSSRLFFGLSFARGGELLTYINKLSGFNEECTRFYSAQILLALEYLHKLGVIHRDLKPENILLNERLHIQITDFGSAFKGSTESIKPYDCESIKKKRTITSKSKERVRTSGGDEIDQDGDDNIEDGDDQDEEDDKDEVNNEEKDTNEEGDNKLNNKQKQNNKGRRASRSNSFVGTAQYVSPEMLRYKRSFTSSDLWAFGCIIYQMLIGSPPFNDANDFLIFQKILALNLTFPDDKMSSEARDLIKSFLVLDPCSRLGALDDFTQGIYPSIRSHPFFTEMQQQPISSPTSSLPGPSYLKQPNSQPQQLLQQYPQTRWSTLHTEQSPLISFLRPEDYNLEARISCLNFDDIEPGLDEGRLLGLGLSINPKKSDPFEKVDSSSTSSPSSRAGYNNNINSNSSSGSNSRLNKVRSLNSSYKENSSRTNNNPGQNKKKGLFSKLFKH